MLSVQIHPLAADFFYKASSHRSLMQQLIAVTLSYYIVHVPVSCTTGFNLTLITYLTLCYIAWCWHWWCKGFPRVTLSPDVPPRGCTVFNLLTDVLDLCQLLRFIMLLRDQHPPDSWKQFGWPLEGRLISAVGHPTHPSSLHSGRWLGDSELKQLDWNLLWIRSPPLSHHLRSAWRPWSADSLTQQYSKI